MELGLSDKKAIVTGGTKGLGRTIAELLLREGAGVAMCARQENELATAAEELPSASLVEAADQAQRGIERVCASDTLVAGFLAHSGLAVDDEPST
jgi:NAD(P)-dependent dehydrogenase (short-subunit alcohol dehydrogenase family)